MVVPGNGRRYFLSSGTEGAALKKTVLKEMVAENRISVLVVEKRKREVVLKLRNHRRLQRCLKQYLSNTCSTKKVLRKLRCLALWNETALLPKCEKIGRACKAFV